PPPTRGAQAPPRLHPHAAYDEALAPPAVAQGSGGDLQHAPDRRIDGLEDADALHPQAEGGEEQGEDAPAHAVVEVVDEPRLGGGEEVAVPVGCLREDLPEA